MSDTSRPALGVVLPGYVGPGRLAFGLALALGALMLVAGVLGRPPALPVPPPRSRPRGRSGRRRFDRTLESLADTVVPAGEGTPGGREAGVVEVIRMTSLDGPVRLPADLYVTWLALVTDAASIVSTRRRFHRLPLERRTRLLGRLLGLFPALYAPVLVAVGFAFSGGIVSGEGVAWLGLPGPVDRLPPGEGADFEPRHLTAGGNLP